MLTRRSFCALAGGLAWSCSQRQPEAEARPNIVFILADDHPNSALSCYGSRVNRTPNLDRIAEEGMRFDRAYVTTSLCSPSRASILTGTYPHVNGQVEIPRLFDGSQATFPSVLQASGYATAIIGKWHLTSEPQGFDHWEVLVGQGAYRDPTLVENGVLQQRSGYATDIITDRSIEWLRGRSQERPFCLLCHHKAPHYVWEPDEKHASLYDDVEFPEPASFDDDHQGRVSPREADLNVADIHEHPTYRRWPAREDAPVDSPAGELKRWNFQRFMRDVLGCVASIDDNVGRLLAALDELGLAENTIVVYTSDNGYFLGEHGWTDKKVIYEESIRVPLMMRDPRSVAAGSVSEEFALNIDLMPTFLDYAGVETPAVVQGRSLRPILEGAAPPDWRSSIYYQIYHANQGIQRRLPHYGIRTERYKLAYWYREIEDWELYDLEKDPQEIRNVYRDPAYAEVVEQLKDELEQERERLGITAELEQEIADKTLRGEWRAEANDYRKRKMEEWRR